MYSITSGTLCEYSLNVQVPQPFNDPPRLTAQETASLAVRFCFLWFVANWSINAALAYTSVASTTVLSSMSGE